MNTKLFYALVWTFSGIVFQLILFFSGLQTENLATGQYVSYLGMLIAAVVLWLGIKAVRDERPERTLGYGQRVGAGVLISLYAGLMSAVYTWFHFKFINVNFADYMISITRAKWAARGMAPSQMDVAEKVTSTMLTPEVQAVLTPIITVLLGLVLSLIIAAFLDSKATGADAPPTEP